MSLQPDTDRRLGNTSRKLTANGMRLLAIALVLDVAGAIFLITGVSGVAGMFCIGLSLPIIIGALMLTSSGAVGTRVLLEGVQQPALLQRVAVVHAEGKAAAPGTLPEAARCDRRRRSVDDLVALIGGLDGGRVEE